MRSTIYSVLSRRFFTSLGGYFVAGLNLTPSVFVLVSWVCAAAINASVTACTEPVNPNGSFSTYWYYSPTLGVSLPSFNPTAMVVIFSRATHRW